MHHVSYSRFVLLILVVIASATGASIVAQDDPCVEFVKAEMRYIDDAVAQLDFEWTPVPGAVWYRLKVLDPDLTVREYLMLGDLGKLVPMSDFSVHPLVGTYAYELIALDVNEQEICRSQPGFLNIEKVYAGGHSGCVANCMAARAISCRYQEFMYGNPYDLCMANAETLCNVYCSGDCNAFYSWICQGNPDVEACIADLQALNLCGCQSCLWNCFIPRALACPDGDMTCVGQCRTDCTARCASVCP